MMTTVFLWSGAAVASLAVKPAVKSSVKSGLEVKTEPVQALLLKLANEKMCDPESEMYCEAHTVFVFKNDAVVLLSVQPTAGLFMVFQKDADQWMPKATYGLLDYEKELAKSKLSTTAQAHFNQMITAYLEARAKSK
jgi:hypothetical protein